MYYVWRYVTQQHHLRHDKKMRNKILYKSLSKNNER